MLEDFHFLRPEWLLAIVPGVLLIWYWLQRTQSDSGWQQAVDAQLLSALMDETHKTSHRWLGRLLMAGVVLGCAAIAGPAWEKLPQNVEQRNDALVIVMDLSLSMLAQDVQPSRVERARQKITDVLRLRDEGLTGLVAYAGDAHSVVPLTDDVGTIENLLAALGPEMMPVPGSNPDHALEIAHELFTNSGLLQGRILIVTDGIDSINSVTRHRNQAFPISIIGIGTTQGGTIPLDKLRQPGKVLLTQEGNQVVALLDHQRLDEVASLSYGRYEPAVLSDADILSALDTRLPGEDETLEVEREFDTWFDQGHWLAVLLVPLALLSFRKGVVLTPAALAPVAVYLACAIAVTIVPGQATAAAGAAPASTVSTPLSDWWDSLWMNDDQRGHAAMRYGQPEKAATLFDDTQWRAAARYRSGDYPTAHQEFLLDESVTGTYNQGNALARLGEYEQAIQHYERVLSSQPEHEDATFNKELLERLLEEQQQAEQEQNEDQQSQANNDENEEQQDQQNQQQEQSDQQQDSDQSEEREQESEEQAEQQQEEGEQQQAQVEEDQAERDEKQEALEQWLRRVPDDPGGLLKRKFTHETKQRLRRGDYENRQGEKIW